MSTKDFSNEFDVLLDSYRRFKSYDDKDILDSIEVNEYEKSIFLTQAQEELVLEIYTGRNLYNDSFEKTEEIRRYLSPLIKTVTLTSKEEANKGISPLSVFYKLPDNLLFITYESVNIEDEKLGCLSGNDITVVPVTQDDFHKIKKNPFRGYNKKRVLRLDAENNTAELVSEYNISSYTIRYLSKPNPIILINLSNNLEINNISKETNCDLNPILHRIILDRAVRKALISKGFNIEK